MYWCMSSNDTGFPEDWSFFTVLLYREVSGASLDIADGFNWIGSTVRLIKVTLASCGYT
jgi:hypothetical protein